jgi:hypothetical protein
MHTSTQRSTTQPCLLPLCYQLNPYLSQTLHLTILFDLHLAMGGFLWEERSLKKDVFIALPEKPKRTLEDVQAYASFGDDGTTVTVNRYGNIMQISRFLEFGSSGFLCVDPQYDNPYWIQDRMNQLIDSLKDREEGLRLDLVDWSEFEDLPSLGFMYDKGTNKAIN